MLSSFVPNYQQTRGLGIRRLRQWLQDPLLLAMYALASYDVACVVSFVACQCAERLRREVPSFLGSGCIRSESWMP